MQKKVDKLAVSSFFSLNLHRLRINTEKMVFKYDFLIIGAGVAGMSYALKVARAHKGKVCMICKTSLDEANTSFAQGGVASVTNLAVDNFDKHIEDTMIAGDFISDRRAVEQVVRNAPERRVRPASRGRTLRVPHPAPRRRHGRRDTARPYGCGARMPRHRR